MSAQRDDNGRFIKPVEEPVVRPVTNIYEYVSKLSRRVDLPRLREEVAKSGIRKARGVLMDVSLAEHDRISQALKILTGAAGKLDELGHH